MDVRIDDRTLSITGQGWCLFIRPCQSWDGRFSRAGGTQNLPWFRVTTWATQSTEYVWKSFSIPYLLVGWVVRKEAME